MTISKFDDTIGEMSDEDAYLLIRDKCPWKQVIDKTTVDVITKKNWDFYAGGELGEILCFTCDDGTNECCSFDKNGNSTNCPFDRLFKIKD